MTSFFFSLQDNVNFISVTSVLVKDEVAYMFPMYTEIRVKQEDKSNEVGFGSTLLCSHEIHLEYFALDYPYVSMFQLLLCHTLNLILE